MHSMNVVFAWPKILFTQYSKNIVFIHFNLREIECIRRKKAGVFTSVMHCEQIFKLMTATFKFEEKIQFFGDTSASSFLRSFLQQQTENLNPKARKFDRPSKETRSELACKSTVSRSIRKIPATPAINSNRHKGSPNSYAAGADNKVTCLVSTNYAVSSSLKTSVMK